MTLRCCVCGNRYEADTESCCSGATTDKRKPPVKHAEYAKADSYVRNLCRTPGVNEGIRIASGYTQGWQDCEDAALPAPAMCGRHMAQLCTKVRRASLDSSNCVFCEVEKPLHYRILAVAGIALALLGIIAYVGLTGRAPL